MGPRKKIVALKFGWTLLWTDCVLFSLVQSGFDNTWHCSRFSPMPRASTQKIRRRLDNIADEAAKQFGRAYRAEEQDNGDIRLILLDRAEPPPAAYLTRALNVCAIRSGMLASGKAVRAFVPRKCPQWMVESVWAILSRPVPVKSVLLLGNCPAAYVRPRDAVTAMIATYNAAGLFRVGTDTEMWLRWGVDGVPLWHSHAESISMACCTELDGIPLQSPERYMAIAVCQTKRGSRTGRRENVSGGRGVANRRMWPGLFGSLSLGLESRAFPHLFWRSWL